MWGPEQQKELERQERLQKERKLDAADMGVVEVDPAELARYRAKQKQTHNRYIQKRQAMMNKGSPVNAHLKPGTPTWIGDADWDAVMRRTFLSCKLQRVPHISAAQAFVVRDVAAPPRMIDLAASLGGGLVASVAHIARPPGPIIRYGRALSQRRQLWISSGARNMSPNTIDLIKKVVPHAATTTTGTRWALICQADFFHGWPHKAGPTTAVDKKSWHLPRPRRRRGCQRTRSATVNRFRNSLPIAGTP